MAKEPGGTPLDEPAPDEDMQSPQLNQPETPAAAPAGSDPATGASQHPVATDAPEAETSEDN